MIETVRIRGFKRFDALELHFPGHVALAGVNDSGKTTVLQAIASWSFAPRRWHEVNRSRSHRSRARVPIARQAFAPVALRSFDLLWTNRACVPGQRAEVEVVHRGGWSLTMAFIADSTEQMYVRPAAAGAAETRRALALPVVLVSAMGGVSVAEAPVFGRDCMERPLGLGRPGEVLRNLLVEVHACQDTWIAMQRALDRLFGCRLRPPDTDGPHIIAGYTSPADGERVRDIQAAGRGFQQALMLLAVLHLYDGAVLLLDNPDAHLHGPLLHAVHQELRAVAARKRSQLIVATHSPVILDALDAREVCVLRNAQGV